MRFSGGEDRNQRNIVSDIVANDHHGEMNLIISVLVVCLATLIAFELNGLREGAINGAIQPDRKRREPCIVS